MVKTAFRVAGTAGMALMTTRSSVAVGSSAALTTMPSAKSSKGAMAAILPTIGYCWLVLVVT